MAETSGATRPLAPSIQHALRRLSASAAALEAELLQLQADLRARAPQPGAWGRRLWLVGLLPLFLAGSAVLPTTAVAQESAAREGFAESLRVEGLAAGYQRGGSLGFAVRDTVLAEELYRWDAGAERSVLWGAHFRSRWALTEDQLDRWSAQASGLLADALGRDVRLAGWERLGATEVGDRRVAYRYALVTSSGAAVGEATIVVFTRGEEVGLSGTAAVGTRPPIDGITLARWMDARAWDG